MKIGILTWFFADNYGARAQSFALQKTLEASGHNVEMINYVPFKNKILNLKMCLSHPGCKINPIKIVRDLIRHLFFQRDKSIYNISTAVRSAQSINELHYDFVILGSDAIFNLLHPMSAADSACRRKKFLSLLHKVERGSIMARLERRLNHV